jgi:isoleucyl-tRNA synthetase
MFDTYGSDAVRWYLVASPLLRGGDVSVSEAGIRDTVRQVLLPLWNEWSFQAMYATAGGASPRVRTDSTHVLDRYVLAKTSQLVTDVTTALDAYDLFGACGHVRTFLDALTNWYVRRSRDRFWAGAAEALDTLHTVLHVLARVAAPLLPLTTEAIYQSLTGERSVHLTDWPSPAELPADAELVAAMDRAREVCSAALSVRKAQGLRVRLPLASLSVATPDADALAPFADLIRDEVNVKELRTTSDVAGVATPVLQIVPAVLGPRLGPDTQTVIRAVREGDWTRDGDTVVAGGFPLQEGEYTLGLEVAGDGASALLGRGDGVVVLDTAITPELEAEGVARDLVRVVQQARRDAGLDVSDRIVLRLDLPDVLRDRLAPFERYVAAETLAVDVVHGPVDGAPVDLDGTPVRLAVARA